MSGQRYALSRYRLQIARQMKLYVKNLVTLFQSAPDPFHGQRRPNMQEEARDLLGNP